MVDGGIQSLGGGYSLFCVYNIHGGQLFSLSVALIAHWWLSGTGVQFRFCVFLSNW